MKRFKNPSLGKPKANGKHFFSRFWFKKKDVNLDFEHPLFGSGSARLGTDRSNKQEFRILCALCALFGFSLACAVGPQPGNIEATVAAAVVASRQADADNQAATVIAAVVATQQAGTPGAGPSEDSLAAPTPTVTILTPVPPPDRLAADREAVRTVVLAELNDLVARDLAGLRSLYLPAALLIDRQATPDDPSDDRIWNGWPQIESRYRDLFAADFSELMFFDLAVQVNGARASATYEGLVVDTVLYDDRGVYRLEKVAGRWLISQLELERQSAYTALLNQAPALFDLQLGAQHRYEEPWGWDRGDPCEARRTGNWDDTKPNYRGFNVELLLTNNSAEPVPDNWPITFRTAKGRSVKVCSYEYAGSGPQPGATSSMTFFTVVEQGDYVETITFRFDDQVIRLCLDGKGGWWRC